MKRLISSEYIKTDLINQRIALYLQINLLRSETNFIQSQLSIIYEHGKFLCKYFKDILNHLDDIKLHILKIEHNIDYEKNAISIHEKINKDKIESLYNLLKSKHVIARNILDKVEDNRIKYKNLCLLCTIFENKHKCIDNKIDEKIHKIEIILSRISKLNYTVTTNSVTNKKNKIIPLSTSIKIHSEESSMDCD